MFGYNKLKLLSSLRTQIYRYYKKYKIIIAIIILGIYKFATTRNSILLQTVNKMGDYDIFCLVIFIEICNA